MLKRYSVKENLILCMLYSVTFYNITTVNVCISIL